VPCEDYSQERVNAAVGEAIELAGLACVFASGKSVLVKPNLLSTRQPEDAVTTHPSVVRAIAEIALRNGCRPSIGDSPPFAGENPTRWERLVRTTGMAEVAQSLHIDIKRFEDAAVPRACPSGWFYHSFQIGAAVAEVDAVVNVPKLKTHGLTLLSGAVKNLFGCIPGIQKGLFHVRAAEDPKTFAQMLVDLCGALDVRAHIMDAIIGMEGEGPNAGAPKHVGAVVASPDPVAMDAVAAALVGVDPMSVDTTRLGHEQGLGCGDLSAIEVRGAAIENMKVHDFKLSSGTNEWKRIPAPIRHMLRRQLTPSPRMDPKECTACGDCVSVCPMDAIKAGRPPSIDYNKCIRCYCCQEVCNFSAVKLKHGLLGRLLLR